MNPDATLRAGPAGPGRAGSGGPRRRRFVTFACCAMAAIAATAPYIRPTVSHSPAPSPPRAAPDAERESVARFARLAIECLHREYPNKISHVLDGDADVRPPRELTPVFHGCYDWHSSVHGHWLLARLARRHPDAPFAPVAIAALDRSFTTAGFEAEVRYLNGRGRVSFERPYGLAWLLQLAAELREWDDERAQRWFRTLQPLERAARDRMAEWIPKLDYPIRVGEHSQTAFSFGLVLDWSRIAGDAEMERLIVGRATTFHLKDRGCPLAWEPGGQDFLSPCLAEADLMRRVMEPRAFASWLAGFLPEIPRDGDGAWLPHAVVSDPGDPKLAHLDGLNLSRAWMLEGMAGGLPRGDTRREALLAAASIHRERGLSAVTGEHYEGGHWLGSFATYLITRRGITAENAASGE